MIIPVILAGGTGSRLWPLSRSMHPKQLLPLLGGRTMLQETALRTREIPDIADPFVICNQDHYFLVNQQLQELNIKATILLEPEGKNTAPAAAIAALALSEKYDNPTLLILPSDHFIKDIRAFTEAIQIAIKHAATGKLVTFGVTPTQPETGYGYIKSGEACEGGFAVAEFVEKPDLATATDYLATSHYYWNSGMFMFNAKPFLTELSTHAPDILAVCQKTLANSAADVHPLKLDRQSFSHCRSDSIDYAVMEKTQAAVLIPLHAAWSDLGSWSALWEMHDADAEGNVLQGDVIAENVEQCYLRAESRMLAVIGVKDHVIVETADAVLVAHRDHSQSVKEIVSQLNTKQRVETVVHKKVYRQWGFYEVLNIGPTYQVKRLTVMPGAKLSLQMHHHRSEHWVVVSGIAEVRCDDKVFQLQANESTYIPCQAMHKLANPGGENLEVIEVQSGHYLGEDDIVRFD